MATLNRIIRYLKTYAYTRQVKKQQRKWQETIDIPKGEIFCPRLYDSCNRTNGSDTNCFLSKAPGCLQAKLYVQNKKPSAHVTK